MRLSVANAVTIATTVELLHDASLVHDDVQNGDALRRGQKAVWFHFGVNAAICTRDLMLSGALLSLPIELVLLDSGYDDYLPNALRAAEAFAQ